MGRGIGFAIGLDEPVDDLMHEVGDRLEQSGVPRPRKDLVEGAPGLGAVLEDGELALARDDDRELPNVIERPRGRRARRWRRRRTTRDAGDDEHQEDGHSVLHAASPYSATRPPASSRSVALGLLDEKLGATVRRPA